MSKAKAEDDTIAGVAGVRFTTDARPGSAQEAQLQRIQYSLSGGVDILPSQTTLPHLAMSAAAAVGGGPRTSSSVISLWVPKDQRAEATKQLEAAGFTVS